MMKMPSLVKVSLLVLPLCSAVACRTSGSPDPGEGSSVSSVSIGKFVPNAGNPNWDKLALDIESLDKKHPNVTKTFSQSDLQSGAATLPQISLPYGPYSIDLVYMDSSGKKLYQECAPVQPPYAYNINTPKFEQSINICKVTGEQVGTVPINGNSNVVLNPTFQGGPAASNPSTQSPSLAPPNTIGSTAPFGIVDQNLSGSCLDLNTDGLPTAIISNAQTQFAASGDLSQLPPLSQQASTVDLKRYVSTVYDLFPTFKAIFEGQLGLNRSQTFAFFYAVMSRESAAGGVWRINIETNPGTASAPNPADSWGPLQAAVTNFTGGGFDGNISNNTGLPVPAIANFRDPATSVYAGMRRLAEGVLNAIKLPNSSPLGKTAQQYLLGAMADHNRGHADQGIPDPNNKDAISFLSDYGFEVLRLAQGYNRGNNLMNDTVFWTRQPGSDLCK